MSLKHFRLTETKGFEFRAQVFNLTNTPSFGSPSGTVNLATGGQVTSTRNQPRLSEFGLKSSYGDAGQPSLTVPVRPFRNSTSARFSPAVSFSSRISPSIIGFSRPPWS